MDASAAGPPRGRACTLQRSDRTRDDPLAHDHYVSQGSSVHVAALRPHPGMDASAAGPAPSGAGAHDASPRPPRTHTRAHLAFEACHRARGARRLAAGLVVRAAIVRIVAVVLVLAAVGGDQPGAAFGRGQLAHELDHERLLLRLGCRDRRHGLAQHGVGSHVLAGLLPLLRVKRLAEGGGVRGEGFTATRLTQRCFRVDDPLLDDQRERVFCAA